MNDAIFSKVVAILLAGGADNLPFTTAATLRVQAKARVVSRETTY